MSLCHLELNYRCLQKTRKMMYLLDVSVGYNPVHAYTGCCWKTSDEEDEDDDVICNGALLCGFD